ITIASRASSSAACTPSGRRARCGSSRSTRATICSTSGGTVRWWGAARAEASTRSTCCWGSSADRSRSAGGPDVDLVAALGGEPVEPGQGGPLVRAGLLPIDGREGAAHVGGHAARVAADVDDRALLELLPHLRPLPPDLVLHVGLLLAGGA